MDAIGNIPNIKRRIEFIDLMKGICIITVVALHFQIFPTNSYINYLRGAFSIPLYFFISGIFFKTNNSFAVLIIKKTNKLIIPLFFFSILFLIIGIPMQWISHGFLFPKTTVSSLLFNNYPLWFLKALFFSYLIFFFIRKFISNDIISTLLCIILSWIGIYFSKEHFKIIDLIDRHTCILNSLVGLIFMHLGTLSNKYQIINKNISKKTSNILIVGTFILLLLTARDSTDFFQRKFNENYIMFLIASCSGIFFTLFLCKRLKKVFLISYLGRYSLIVLGTHLLYQALLSPVFLHYTHNGLFTSWCTFLVTICSLYLFGIKIIIKLFPYFSAQKDLITYNKQVKG